MKDNKRKTNKHWENKAIETKAPSWNRKFENHEIKVVSFDNQLVLDVRRRKKKSSTRFHIFIKGREKKRRQSQVKLTRERTESNKILCIHQSICSVVRESNTILDSEVIEGIKRCPSYACAIYYYCYYYYHLIPIST